VAPAFQPVGLAKKRSQAGKPVPLEETQMRSGLGGPDSFLACRSVAVQHQLPDSLSLPVSGTRSSSASQAVASLSLGAR
jgi:hypothetical protein